MAAAGGALGEGGSGGGGLAGGEGGGSDEGALGGLEDGEEGGEEARGGGEDSILVVGGEVKGAVEGGGEVGVAEVEVAEGDGDAVAEPRKGDVEGRRGDGGRADGEVEGEEVAVAEATIGEGAGRVLVFSVCRGFLHKNPVNFWSAFFHGSKRPRDLRLGGIS